jgi:hypothetical protein
MRAKILFAASCVVIVVASCRASAPQKSADAPRPVASTQPVASASAAPPAPPPSIGADKIDAMIAAEWQKNGITPAAPADDATFLRRTYVDIVGTTPPPDVVNAFAADASPDKRKKVVDKLLASPEYAEHWMNYWDDVLMGRETRGNVVDRMAFRQWLRKKFQANAPWSTIVYELVAATGQNSTGGPKSKVAAAMPIVEDKERDEEAAAEGVNAAVNYALRFQDSPQDYAGSSSRTFLGVQIQCAQCHDHKTEKWKQDDFRKISSAFLHLRIKPVDQGKMNGEIRRVDLLDFNKVMPRVQQNPDTAPISRSKATALDGTDLDKGDDTRKALARWMTSPENPWFAKAIVNRMWGHFLGRGFVDPVDDIRPSNPATMPELLDALAADFVAHGYDLKYLTSLITSTRAYQLASSAGTADDVKADADNKLWWRFHLVPLGPEELLNAIMRATNVDEAARRAGVANMAQLRFQLVRAFSFLFDVDEEFDTHDYEGTVAQALTLLNGNLVNYGVRAIPGAALTDILAQSKSDPDAVEGVYLRVLARKPTPEETAAAIEYVQNAHNGGAGSGGQTSPPIVAIGKKLVGKKKPQGDPLGRLGNKNPTTADPRRAAFEDINWALLNSSEFLFNH